MQQAPRTRQTKADDSLNYNYVAWFRDHAVAPEDEDHEWCACFIIAAANSVEAQAWGDQLAKDHARRMKHEEFLRSHLDSAPWLPKDAPRVVVGKPVSDDEIGW